MKDTKYQVNMLKCPACRDKTYVSAHGFEKNTRSRIYKCKRASNHESNCTVYFRDSQKSKVFKELKIKDIILIRCDKCNKSEYIRLFGSYEDNRFSCVNPDCKTKKGKYIFTQKDISSPQSLKMYIESASADTKLYSELKKINSSISNDEKKYLLQKCFDLGLKQKDIAEVFGVDYSRISKWKKEYSLIADNTTKVKFIDKRKNVFMRQIVVQNQRDFI